MVNINKIKMLTKEKGRSIAYICKQLGVTRVYFNDIERSGRDIPQDKLIKISDMLNTTPEYLKDLSDVKEKPTVNSDNELDNEIIKLFNELPPQLQEQAMRHLRFLASEKDSEDKK